MDLSISFDKNSESEGVDVTELLESFIASEKMEKCGY